MQSTCGCCGRLGVRQEHATVSRGLRLLVLRRDRQHDLKEDLEEPGTDHIQFHYMAHHATSKSGFVRETCGTVVKRVDFTGPEFSGELHYDSFNVVRNKAY